MKSTASKKPVSRKRITMVLAIVCCLSILVGTLAFFTDRVNQNTTATAGTLDLVFNDISASRSGANGILSPNEFAIDGVWGRSLVQENSIINPGDYFDLSYNLSSVGSKSMDVKHQLTLESTTPLTGNEYKLTIIDENQNEVIVPGTLSADGLKITYEMPEFVLNGIGAGAEVEDEASGSSKDFIVRLDLNAEVGNALQGAGVTVTLDSQAKQHRNTDDDIWVDWAEYKIGVEQTGAQYQPELVSMLAAQDTWFSQGAPSTLKRASITEIAIVDEYTPTGNETATWDASDASVPGTVTAYVEGTKLTLAGNGYGCVYANPDSTAAFSSTGSDYFSTLTTFTGANLLNTSKTSNMKDMFRLANKLKTVDVSKWDISNVTNMYRMFAGNTSNMMALETLDVSKWDTSKVTDMTGAFQCCKNLTALNVSDWNVVNVTTMQNMFKDCQSLSELDVSNWKVDNVTKMNSMFSACFSLEELDVSKWNVSKVTNFSMMFTSGPDNIGDMKLKHLDVSNWNTSSATDMNNMFNGCSNLVELDVSKWNVSKVTDMRNLVSSCRSLTSFDTTNWNASNVTKMSAMFYGCSGLTSLDVSGFNTTKVNTFENVFNGCTSLESIEGLHNWDVSSGLYFYETFNGCSSLKTLNLSGWDTSNVEEMFKMFAGCTSLETIYVSEEWSTESLAHTAVKEDSVTVGYQDSHIFKGCTKLVGGAGTKYANDKVSYSTADTSVDVQYAHIDEGTANPGYLTYKAAN